MTDRFYPPSEWRRLYPESDGNPTVEDPGTLDWLMRLYTSFRGIYRDREDVTVSARLFWYASQGRPETRHAPHLMVVFGRPPLSRLAYLQWLEEDIAPQVVFEIDPRLETEGRQAEIFDFYERHGVEEYYRIDWMFGEFVGWKRSPEGRLARISEMNGWVSPRLQVRFEVSGLELRIFDSDGQPFRSPVEIIQERERIRKETEEIQRETEAIQREKEAILRQTEAIREECRQMQEEIRRLKDDSRRLNTLIDQQTNDVR